MQSPQHGPSVEDLALLEECGLVMSPDERKGLASFRERERAAFAAAHSAAAGRPGGPPTPSSDPRRAASPGRSGRGLGRRPAPSAATRAEGTALAARPTSDLIYQMSVENAKQSGVGTKHAVAATTPRHETRRHFPPSNMSGGTTVDAAAADIRIDDLSRQLETASQRLSMLESLLSTDTHYHETVELLREYQERLSEHSLSTTSLFVPGSHTSKPDGKASIGYHVPTHVARAKERIHTKRMVTTYLQRSAQLVKRLREYEVTIHSQQQLLTNPHLDSDALKRLQQHTAKVADSISPASKKAIYLKSLSPPPLPATSKKRKKANKSNRERESAGSPALAHATSRILECLVREGYDLCLLQSVLRLQVDIFYTAVPLHRFFALD